MSNTIYTHTVDRSLQSHMTRKYIIECMLLSTQMGERLMLGGGLRSGSEGDSSQNIEQKDPELAVNAI